LLGYIGMHITMINDAFKAYVCVCVCVCVCACKHVVITVVCTMNALDIVVNVCHEDQRR